MLGIRHSGLKKLTGGFTRIRTKHRLNDRVLLAERLVPINELFFRSVNTEMIHMPDRLGLNLRHKLFRRIIMREVSSHSGCFFQKPVFGVGIDPRIIATGRVFVILDGLQLPFLAAFYNIIGKMLNVAGAKVIRISF